MNVLFVQNQPLLATALQITLQKKGFNLIVSDLKSIPTGVLLHTQPAVVIADISTAIGISYLEEAKKLFIPVLVIAANNAHNNLQTAFDKGADDYISLPLSLSELALRVGILTLRSSVAVA